MQMDGRPRESIASLDYLTIFALCGAFLVIIFTIHVSHINNSWLIDRMNWAHFPLEEKFAWNDKACRNE